MANDTSFGAAIGKTVERELDPTDEPISEATVFLLEGWGRLRFPADSRGEYAVAGLAEGVYRLWTSAAGYADSSERMVVLDCAGIVTADFRLEPLPSGEGEGEGECDRDTVAPVITLRGESEMGLEAKVDIYAESGATAQDNCDGDISHLIEITGTVDGNLVGDYTLTYAISDASGNPALLMTRTVHVVDSTPPVIELEDDLDMRVPVGEPFTEPEYTASDGYDGDLTSAVEVTGAVDVEVVGTYSLQYTVSDSSGNPAAPITRLVHVYDRQFPVIRLLGSPEMTLEAKVDAYTEPGATAWDVYDGDISGKLVISGEVNPSVVGDYSVSYNVRDSSGNPAPRVQRVIHVRDTRPPVITLQGESSVQIEVGTPYNDAGATALDLYDGDISLNIAVGNPVSIANPGVYYVTYIVSDSSGNLAEPITRIVQVVRAGGEGEGEGEGEGAGCFGASPDAGSRSMLLSGDHLLTAFAVLLLALTTRHNNFRLPCARNSVVHTTVVR